MTMTGFTVKRRELAGDEDLVRVRATQAVRVACGDGFECEAAAGAEGEVTRAEWIQFVEPTGLFEEVS